MGVKRMGKCRWNKKIYLKWVMGVDRNTLGVDRRETKEGKLWEEAVYRALKYE